MLYRHIFVNLHPNSGKIDLKWDEILICDTPLDL